MDIVIVIILVAFLYGFIKYLLAQKLDKREAPYIWTLAVVHILLSSVYYIYAAFSSSDSQRYYRISSTTDDWFGFFGTGTTFIKFIAWPFTNYIGLSYYASMVVFSFIGLVGILLLYSSAKENINEQRKIVGSFGLIELVFLLPNLHFWSSSIGKGSVIMLGIGLIFWGLSRFDRRYMYIILGSILVYLVRPHIFLAILMGVVTGLMFSTLRERKYLRVLIIIIALIVFYFISDDVVEFTDTDIGDIFDPTSNLQHRATSLMRAGSGVDIGNYSIFMKMFTFWFRPLFVDSPNILGWIVSFENLIYIYMFYIVISEGIKQWTSWNGWYRICIFTFIFGSIAQAQVSGNLGVAIRQKAQLMPLLFIIFCKAMAEAYDRKHDLAGRIAVT